MEQIFGASYSAAMGIGRGIKDFNEGHVDRAIESFVPSVIRNPLKAFRFATDGAQTRDGKSIVAKEEFSNREIVLQALGFTPLKFAERSKAAGTMSQQMKRLEERKQSIYNKFYLAYIISKSEEDKAEAQAAREKFNNSPFVIANNERIKDEDIRRSIAQRRRMAQQSVYGVNVPLKRRAAYESYLREQDQEGT
jgi:hypothetical protein